MIALLTQAIFSKAGTILAGGSAIVLAFLLVAAKIDEHRLSGQNDQLQGKLDKLDKVIIDCHANVTVMQSAIDGQNASIAAAKARGDQIASDAAKAVQQAQDALQKARKAAGVISAPLVASSVCARVDEVDARFLKGLM